VTDHDPDQLVTLHVADSYSDARITVALLNEGGIDAVAHDAVQSMMGIDRTTGGVLATIPVQVRAADLERALEILVENGEDAQNLDWDKVDVGEFEDDAPPTSGDHASNAARIKVVLAVIVVIVVVVGAWKFFGP